MSISREEVLHVARLAHLDLTEEETEAMTRDLAKVLDYVARLESADTAGVVEEEAGMGRSALRPDRVAPGLSPEEALKPAPLVENGLFKVPPAFGEA